MDKEKKLIKKFADLSTKDKPKPQIFRNCLWAFCIGGAICDVGQLIIHFASKYDFTKDQVAAITSIIMVFIGAFLTGVGIYDKIAEKGGAGTVVPITGFANAIVSAAIEFKKEGFVFGVAARMFNIAGPVLVYGIGSSVVIGIIYYIISLF